MAFYSKKFTNNKYRARKTIVYGITFASKLEAETYCYLNSEIFKQTEKIKSIELQPKVYMTEAKILMKPDFKIHRIDGTYFYVESKGDSLPVFNIKKRLWVHYGDGELRVIKKKSNKLYLDETIKTIASTKK